MDGKRFDDVIRTLRDGATRRGVLAAAAGLTGLHVGDGAARRHQRGRKSRGDAKRLLRAQAKPGREVTDLTADFTDESCGFPVQVHLEGQEIALDLGDRLIFTYAGTNATLTNPATGASLRVAIPGPEFVHFNEDGSVTVRGAGPWLFLPRHPETREPGIWLVRGLSLRTFVDRQLTAIEIRGTSRNLCAAIA